MESLLWLAIAAVLFFLVARPVLERFKRGDNQEASELPVKLIITTEYRTEGVSSESLAPDSEHDNWEGSFWNVQSPRNLQANLRIEYRDGAGSVTTRQIRLMKYGPWEGGAILWAYCHLRNANRTFRTDRIVSCVDLDTGEVIENLETWLDAKYQGSPDRALEEIIETAWDAIRVLFYVSKADGRLTQKERTILRDAIRSMSNHPAIDDKRIDDLIQTLDIPSLTAFKQAFGRLIKQNRELAEKVVAWSDSLIATEKSIAATEQEAIDYLKTRLANASERPN